MTAASTSPSVSLTVQTVLKGIQIHITTCSSRHLAGSMAETSIFSGKYLARGVQIVHVSPDVVWLDTCLDQRHDVVDESHRSLLQVKHSFIDLLRSSLVLKQLQLAYAISNCLLASSC
jgi:hypothetical protein